MGLFILKYWNNGYYIMNLKFTVFFDIKNLDDFFYKTLLPPLSKKHSVRNYKCDTLPTLSQTSNILNCTRIIYKNNKAIVIYEDNLIDGGWVYISSIAKNYNIRTLYVRLNDENPYPGYYLAYFEKGSERVIYNVKENKWKFYNQGPVAFFEKDEKYLEKKVSDKFNKEKLILFCNRIGLDILDKNFFIPSSRIYCIQRVT